MKTAEPRLSKRLFAFLLVVMMVLSMFPIPVSAADGEPASFTVTVKCGDTPLNGVLLKYSVDQGAQKTAMTNENGQAEIPELAAALEEADSVSFSYSAELDGYKPVPETTVSVNKGQTNLDVEMTAKQPDEPETVTIKVSNTISHGSVTLGADKVTELEVIVGETFTVNVEPEEGYRLTELKVGTADADASTQAESYEFTAVENADVTATFKKSVTIKVANNIENGIVQIGPGNGEKTNELVLAEGDTFVIYVEPGIYYHLDTLKIDTQSVTVEEGKTEYGPFTAEATATVSATFKKNVVTVTIDNSIENGSIWFEGNKDSVTLNAGETFKVYYKASLFYHLATLKYNEVFADVSTQASYYEFTAESTGNVTATFERNFVTVTADTNVAHGTVRLNGDKTSVSLYAYDTFKINVSPDDHYRLASLYVGDEEVEVVDGQTEYEWTATASVTVTATFEVSEYVVAIIPGENGTVVTSPSFTDDEESNHVAVIPNGEKFKLTATPNANYRVSEVKLDGEDISFDGKGDNNAVVNNMEIPLSGEVNHTLEVVFALNEFEVNYSATGDGSGTITCKDVQENDIASGDKVVYGTKLLFTVVADDGSYSDGLLYNGEQVPASSLSITDEGYVYTITSVNKSITVEAPFELEEPNAEEALDYFIYSAVVEVEGNPDESGIPTTVEENGILNTFLDDDGTVVVVVREGSTVTISPNDTYIAQGYQYISYRYMYGRKWQTYKTSQTREVTATDEWQIWKIAISKDPRKGEPLISINGNGEKALIRFVSVANDAKVLDKQEDAYIFDIGLLPDGVELGVNTNEQLTAAAVPANKIYSSDVELGLRVTDLPAECASGIARVEYWVEDAGNRVQPEGEIESTDAYTVGEGEDPVETLTIGGIKIDSNLCNSGDLIVHIRITDVAGNEFELTQPLKINIDEPVLNVSFNNDSIKANGSRVYSHDPVTVTVTVWDKNYCFDTETALKLNPTQETGENPTCVIGMSVSRNNRDDISLPDEHKPVQEKDTNGNPVVNEKGQCKYVYTLDFKPDSNYMISNLNYLNLAGQTASNSSSYSFTCDKTPPTGTITMRTDSWSDLASALTFGIIDNKTVNVSMSKEDSTSPCDMFYYISSGEEAKAILDANALNMKTWTPYTTEFTIGADQQRVVYERIVDKAGNVAYVSSTGVIVEDDQPTGTVAPVKPAPATGFYNLAYSNTNNGVVSFKIDVRDLDKIPSGLASVKWYFTLDGNKVGEDKTLSSFNKDAPSYAELEKTFTYQANVDVPMTANNGEVAVVVVLVDNAGNASTIHSDPIRIDTVRPTINVSYDKFNASTFYNTDRTATITINEVNFRGADVKTVITNTDGAIPALNGWGGTGLAHTATITYHNDGDYTFEVSYTDLAGNEATELVYAQADAKSFTIDQTLPVISVSYNNNNAANGKYFNASRTATVTVTEHNFDPARVVFTPAQNVNWANNGDTHTVTIAYAEDGDYTFDVSATDLADNASQGVNYGDSAAPTAFTVDTTFEDMVTIADVEDGKAYSYQDAVIPNISVEDTNFDTYEVTLVGMQRANTVDLTEEVKQFVEKSENGVSGLFDVFRKTAEYDGIYTLYVKGVDLAGNIDEEQIRFTVNRFGSVYEYSDSLMNLIENGGTYNQSIDEDLTFSIYNASPIDPDKVSVVITRDGRPVDAVFTVSETTADGEGWYSYLVTVDKSNFAEDGVYTMSVTTTDDADNTVENTGDNSDGDIAFYVDSTAPQLTSVVGLEESIVNATELEVSYTVYDTIGLASVQVKVDGEIVDTATEFDDVSNYSGKFTIYEKSSAQHVSFILTDKAGNVTESDAEGFAVPYTLEKDVTVSTNLFVRWFANKPLFYGGIGGGVAVLGGLGALAALKKKKRVAVTK